MEHCCNEMVNTLEQDELHFGYNPVRRNYFIDYRKEFGEGSAYRIKYCPWCRAKLPKPLGEKRLELLDEIFGDYDEITHADQLPEEFKTDEWWKKRGL
ncbi:MAG: hypothetical protein GY795_00490 [Desulfobacterales bacterium]|nr:hypothetical protein [Desulfobacterales bacterium]